MEKQWVRDSLTQREVRFREIFVWSFELMRERIAQYIFLTIIVFLPSNLLVSMLLQKLPEAVDMRQYLQVSALQLLANLDAHGHAVRYHSGDHDGIFVPADPDASGYDRDRRICVASGRIHVWRQCHRGPAQHHAA